MAHPEQGFVAVALLAALQPLLLSSAVPGRQVGGGSVAGRAVAAAVARLQPTRQCGVARQVQGVHTGGHLGGRGSRGSRTSGRGRGWDQGGARTRGRAGGGDKGVQNQWAG